jgi:hypothetical protein
MRCHTASLPAVPVPAADALGQLLPLLGRQDVGDVGERLGEAHRRLLDKLELIDA